MIYQPNFDCEIVSSKFDVIINTNIFSASISKNIKNIFILQLSI